MLISAKIIKRPRTNAKCSFCGGYLQIGSPRVRLYGAAEVGDSPYVIYEHLKCAELAISSRIKRVVEEYNQSLDSDTKKNREELI